MGCPTPGGCTGYELRADLTFDENGDGQMTSAGAPTYWNSGSGWLQIASYAAAFRGNGHTVSYLYVNRPTTHNVGLFNTLSAGSSVDGVGLPFSDVTGNQNAGILAASLAGSVTRVWTTGRVAGSNRVAGLVGNVTGSVKASWSTAAVHASSGRAGGLVDALIGSLTASWSAGRVTATEGGGLVGIGVGTVTNSYWDTGTSGWSTSRGGGTGKSTRDLQRLTGYSGIYTNWNLNLDGDANTGDGDVRRRQRRAGGGHGGHGLAAALAQRSHALALAALYGERRHGDVHAARAGDAELVVHARRRRRGGLPAGVRLLLLGRLDAGVDARRDGLHRRRRCLELSAASRRAEEGAARRGRRATARRASTRRSRACGSRRRSPRCLRTRTFRRRTLRSREDS